MYMTLKRIGETLRKRTSISWSARKYVFRARLYVHEATRPVATIEGARSKSTPLGRVVVAYFPVSAHLLLYAEVAVAPQFVRVAVKAERGGDVDTSIHSTVRWCLKTNVKGKKAPGHPKRVFLW